MPAPPRSRSTAPRPAITATISPPARRCCGWRCGRPASSRRYEIFAVTADPAEGEAFTEAGSDLVDVVPMPQSVRAVIDGFVAEHHVERPFHKRKRDRADPEALARARTDAERAEMSDPENFIARWSRRKREVERQGELTKQEVAPEQAERAAQEAEAKSSPQASSPLDHGESHQAPSVTAGKVPFDSRACRRSNRSRRKPTSAPSWRPGVPAELTRAALRRAWSADPRIRDFVGLAENTWDFNAPGAISGFGPLEMTDELRREVARMVGRSLGAADPTGPLPPDRGARRASLGRNR